jgi:cytochrome P450
MSFMEWFFKSNTCDIIFSDCTKEWEALEKVGHMAAWKFASSPQLPAIVFDAVDRMLDRVSDWPVDADAMITETFERMFKRAEENHTSGKNDSFCDALISARKETESHVSGVSSYLKNENLHNAILDLFAAGIDTSLLTTKWIMLLMAKYPEIQEQMRQEVLSQFGDSPPRLE